MGLPIKLSDVASVLANTPLAEGPVALMKGAGKLMEGAGKLMERAAEDINFGKAADAVLKVATPANAVKTVGTAGGCTVGYCGGAALGTGIGFAVGGPVGAAIGYGIGILTGAGTGAVAGFKAGKAVTHALELPEGSPNITVSRDKAPDVIEAPDYSVQY